MCKIDSDLYSADKVVGGAFLRLRRLISASSLDKVLGALNVYADRNTVFFSRIKTVGLAQKESECLSKESTIPNDPRDKTIATTENVQFKLY